MNEFQESVREQVFVVAILSRRWFRSGAFFISATNLHHSYRLHPRAFPRPRLFSFLLMRCFQMTPSLFYRVSIPIKKR